MAWGEPQTPLSAESRDSRLGRNARRLDTIAPGEEDRSAQWRRFGNLCEAQAPPLPGAHDAEWPADAEVPRGRGVQVDRPRSCERDVAVEDQHVVGKDGDPAQRQGGEERALSGSTFADHTPGAPIEHERAGVKAFPIEPVRRDGRHRGEVRMDQLQVRERTLHPEDDAAALSVDAYLAARLEAQFRGGVIDDVALTPGWRVDFGTNMERRPARIRGD